MNLESNLFKRNKEPLYYIRSIKWKKCPHHMVAYWNARIVIPLYSYDNTLDKPAMSCQSLCLSVGSYLFALSFPRKKYYQ